MIRISYCQIYLEKIPVCNFKLGTKTFRLNVPDYSCHLGIMHEKRNALVWEDQYLFTRTYARPNLPFPLFMAWSGFIKRVGVTEKLRRLADY